MKPIKSSLLPLIVCLLSFLFSTTLLATELHRGNGAEPKTLDIHKSSGVPAANIERDLFEGLVIAGADGRLIAGAATTWQVSEDGLRWTFTLRKNSQWSDGSKVTANDFVFAFRRALDPNTGSEYAFILWAIKNAKAISKGNVKSLEALGIKAIDKHTLEITLDHPVPYLPSLLTHSMAYPLPEKVIKTFGKKWVKPNNMVSNGAYTLAEWTPHSHIKLIKNPKFHAAESVKIDTVFYYPTEDSSAELKRFRAGEIDLTDAVPSTEVSWIKKNLAEAYHNPPYIGTYYYAMNLEKAPFANNPDLRKALNLAINREILTDKITKAGEFPTMSWVPEGMNHYKTQRTPDSKLSQKERLEKAKALYKKAGYSKNKPVEIEILYNTSDNHKKIAIAISAMWKQTLGVKTTLRNEEWKVYLNSRTQRQFQVIRASWIGDYDDASTFLDLLRSDIGTMNPSSWKNKTYDSLMKQAETEADADKREKMMQQAEQIMLDDTAIIPIYHYTSKHLVNPKIKGWVDNVMDVHSSRFLSK